VSPVTKLKSRVTDYLGYESQERSVLRSTLGALTERLPDTAIFGGMLRDFALKGTRNFTSDIDLVTFASPAEISLAIKDLTPRRNKFGGYRFAAGRWRFDIWSFHDTWAFRQGIVRGSGFTDLFATTFFNVDAAIFHLSSNEFRFSPTYEQGIVRRLLEVNLEANPSPVRMARRAIRLAMERELSIGPALAEFILTYADRLDLAGVDLSFLHGLRRHVEVGAAAPYSFRPQQVIEMTAYDS
jgi:hypothetical protein